MLEAIRSLSPISVAFATCLALNAGAQPPNQTPAPPESTPAQPAEEAPPNRIALLIGVGQASFKGVAQVPLPQCVVDAKTLAATLRPRGYACAVVADGEKIEPTAEQIRKEISGACATAGPTDHLLIHISTHGDRLDGKSVIIAKDDAVDVDWIKQRMAESKAAVKVLMLDCCRNNKGFERISNEVRDVHCIMACRPDQLSQVGMSGMSVFTEALVDGLVECRADRVIDGKIELDEIVYFLEREVPLRAAKVNKDKPQNPTRTVVDPKFVTPIFAECTHHDRLTFGPAAFANVEPPAPRYDLELVDLTFLRVQPRMNLEEVTKAVGGSWTQDPQFDDKGVGMGLLEGKPSEKDVLVVRFEDRKVVLAHVLYRELCKEHYESLTVRAAIQAIMGGEKDPPLAKLGEHLTGLTPAEIVKKLGSPDEALLPTGQFAGQPGELRYPQAPRPGQMLLIRIEHGKFESVDVAPIE